MRNEIGITNIHMAQNLLRDMLFRFLNNPRTRPNQNSYWDQNREKLRQAFPQDLRGFGDCSKTWRGIAQTISSAFSAFGKYVNEQDISEGRKVIIPAWQAKVAKSDEITNTELFKSLMSCWNSDLHNFALGFYVHRSLASRDYTAYSDCDTMIFLKSSSAQSMNDLIQLRNILIPT
jgi:hypothetical protein